MNSPDAAIADAAVADVADSDSAIAPVQEPPWSGQTVEPGCTANGCIHSFAEVSSYPKSILQSFAAPSFTVQNGIVIYSITYVSDGAEITGSVYYPDSPAPSAGFPIVVMNQLTTGLNPSCAPSSGLLGVGVASATALNGMVTVVPDATSYGKQPYGAYMDAPIAGKAALDAARAAFHTGQASGYPIARSAIIAGLSEGAFSTMAAATILPTYASQLEIRGFVAAEPPSNMRQTTNAALTSTTAFVGYDAMRLYSWDGLHALGGGQLFQPPYDTQAPAWFASACIYNGSDGTAGTLYNDFLKPLDDGGPGTTPVPASSIFSSTFLGYAQNDSWPQSWLAAFAASNTVPSDLSLPVLILEGTADVTVLPADVDAYVAQLQAAGVNVDYRKIAGGTHSTTALSSFTVDQLANDQAVQWMQQKLAN